jgi:hypothetical protein
VAGCATPRSASGILWPIIVRAGTKRNCAGKKAPLAQRTKPSGAGCPRRMCRAVPGGTARRVNPSAGGSRPANKKPPPANRGAPDGMSIDEERRRPLASGCGKPEIADGRMGRFRCYRGPPERGRKSLGYFSMDTLAAPVRWGGFFTVAADPNRRTAEAREWRRRLGRTTRRTRSKVWMAGAAARRVTSEIVALLRPTSRGRGTEGC